MPKNAKKITYKEKEFQTYVLWKSIPAYFRGMKREQLHSHGFTDPLILKIAMIKNQTDFAKKFNIKDLGTLTDWNNKIKENKLDTNTAKEIFQKEAVEVGNTLSSKPQKLLEKKIFEQQKLITLLKKENENFKKQLEAVSIKKAERESRPALIKPAVVIEKNKSLFQKMSDALFGKRR